MRSPSSQIEEPIVIPYNEKGQRVFDVFRTIAERHFNMAKTAVEELIARDFPSAEKVGEIAMFGLKYSAVYEYGGVRRTVTYDYTTNEVFCERT